jgi:hypothetical protein
MSLMPRIAIAGIPRAHAARYNAAASISTARICRATRNQLSITFESLTSRSLEATVASTKSGSRVAFPLK